MNHKWRAAVRWPLLAGGLGVVLLLLACTTTAVTPSTEAETATPPATEAPVLRLEDGAVKVRGQDTDWMPVAGESTFELVGGLESTDPWMVTGNTFATRDTTRIAEGLEVGDLVRVKGIILEDNTWLANSIELAGEQTGPTMVLVGKVSSIDPWVVHGITINVTADTAVNGEITPDMFVVVEILLHENGTWEVLSISTLSHFTEIPGCATVTATVESVNGNEVHFKDWPPITLRADVTIENEDGTPGTIAAGQEVLVVVCSTEDGQFAITKIILLPQADDEATQSNGGKVLVCHKPDNKGGNTLSIATAALPAHLAHGDRRGACP